MPDSKRPAPGNDSRASSHWHDIASIVAAVVIIVGLGGYVGSRLADTSKSVVQWVFEQSLIVQTIIAMALLFLALILNRFVARRGARKPHDERQ